MKSIATTEQLAVDYHIPAKQALSSIQSDGLDKATPALPYMSLIAESRNSAHLPGCHSGKKFQNSSIKETKLRSLLWICKES